MMLKVLFIFIMTLIAGYWLDTVPYWDEFMILREKGEKLQTALSKQKFDLANREQHKIELQRKKKELADPIRTMKLVGTLMQGDKVLGLIVMADNKTYPVTVGMYIGQHMGRITNILENKIEITEPVEGKKEQRVRVLMMK